MNFDALPLIHSATGPSVAFGLPRAFGTGLSIFFRRRRQLGMRA